jgi:hypothetical protein
MWHVFHFSLLFRVTYGQVLDFKNLILPKLVQSKYTISFIKKTEGDALNWENSHYKQLEKEPP